MNECKMSLFQNPIAPQRDPQGRILKAATLTPAMEVTPADVYQLITCNEPLRLATLQVRNAADIRAAKASLLPYVTPCGVFTRRRSDCLTESSGLVVVDIDHLESAEETENLRQQLFDDPYLCPALVFISPTGRGVKAFVPCLHGQNPAEGIQWAMNYVHCMYDAENTQPGKGVDTSGKDLVRACFLCHDPKALLRKVVNFE
jgi:hypothetical protein